MAGELLASIDDINVHLPLGKAEIDDASDDVLQVEAHRFIRAKLAGTFATTTISSWVSPATTPDIIRSIAGMVIAAKWYTNLYAEDSDEENSFGLNLYNQALSLMEGVRNGEIIVYDPTTGDPIEGSGLLVEASFWPSDDDPKFTMDQVFG